MKTGRMPSIAIGSIVCVLLGCSPQAQGEAVKDVAAAPRSVDPTSPDDKVVYGLGLVVAQSLSVLALSPHEREVFEEALRDHREGTLQVQLGDVLAELSGFQQQRAALAREYEREAAEEFLAAAAREPGASKLDTGTVIRSVAEGDAAAESPTESDAVVLNFETRLRDGTVVDSSASKGGAQTFAFNGTLACWLDVLRQMKPGSKVVLSCPHERAYGEIGQPPLIPAGSALEFDLELVSVKKDGARAHGGMLRMLPGGGAH